MNDLNDKMEKNERKNGKMQMYQNICIVVPQVKVSNAPKCF